MRNRHATGWRVGAILWLCLAVSTQAGMIDKDGVAPQEICALCHSLDGVSRMAKFPKLAGQKAAYIKKQFLDFHAGRRTNDGGQMSGIAGEVGTAQIDAIAHYFSQLPAPVPTPVPQDPQSQAAYRNGAALFAKGRAGLVPCATCHGVRAREMALSPWLDTQHGAYLTKQLQDYKSGRRDNDPDAVMRSIAAKLTEAEMEGLALYLQSTTLRDSPK